MGRISVLFLRISTCLNVLEIFYFMSNNCKIQTEESIEKESHNVHLFSVRISHRKQIFLILYQLQQSIISFSSFFHRVKNIENKIQGKQSFFFQKILFIIHEKIDNGEIKANIFLHLK